MLTDTQSGANEYESYTDWDDLDDWGILEGKEKEALEQNPSSSYNIKCYTENKSVTAKADQDVKIDVMQQELAQNDKPTIERQSGNVMNESILIFGATDESNSDILENSGDFRERMNTYVDDVMGSPETNTDDFLV